jgi:hypothetical protein
MINIHVHIESIILMIRNSISNSTKKIKCPEITLQIETADTHSTKTSTVVPMFDFGVVRRLKQSLSRSARPHSLGLPRSQRGVGAKSRDRLPTIHGHGIP